MTMEDQDFIREYCEKYGIETAPGPGAPCLNGVALTGEAIERLFAPVERVDKNFFYSFGEIKLTKKSGSKVPPSGETMLVSYGGMPQDCAGWNEFQMDKLAS